MLWLMVKKRDSIPGRDTDSPNTAWTHDLNNVVGAMRLHLTLARIQFGSNPPPEVEQLLHKLEGECEKVAALLEISPMAKNSKVREPLAGRAQPLKKSTTGKRILLMDDNESLLDSLAKILRELGYEVELSIDGVECITRFQTLRAEGRAVDLVILDVKVPGGLGGIETLIKLRRINPKLKAVASSGYSETDIMIRHEDYGFQGCLEKPFRAAEMAELLHKILGP